MPLEGALKPNSGATAYEKKLGYLKRTSQKGANSTLYLKCLSAYLFRQQQLFIILKKQNSSLCL